MQIDPNHFLQNIFNINWLKSSLSATKVFGPSKSMVLSIAKPYCYTCVHLSGMTIKSTHVSDVKQEETVRMKAMMINMILGPV
ncbi:MAG TPA: hypothetical protein VE378_04170 [Nitrososphaeraceae archaeon]|nr:hypothetical protein [Nitrososphaeraceae archaeon]